MEKKATEWKRIRQKNINNLQRSRIKETESFFFFNTNGLSKKLQMFLALILSRIIPREINTLGQELKKYIS